MLITLHIGCTKNFKQGKIKGAIDRDGRRNSDPMGSQAGGKISRTEYEGHLGRKNIINNGIVAGGKEEDGLLQFSWNVGHRESGRGQEGGRDLAWRGTAVGPSPSGSGSWG